jgi:hypothetical protein
MEIIGVLHGREILFAVPSKNETHNLSLSSEKADSLTPDFANHPNDLLPGREAKWQEW